MTDKAQSPLVDAVFPFEKLQHAFARLKHGPLGKVVVEVATARS